MEGPGEDLLSTTGDDSDTNSEDMPELEEAFPNRSSMEAPCFICREMTENADVLCHACQVRIAQDDRIALRAQDLVKDSPSSAPACFRV